MTDQLGQNRASATERRHDGAEPQQWNPVQDGDGKRTKAPDGADQPAPREPEQQRSQRQPESWQPQQQPQQPYSPQQQPGQQPQQQPRPQQPYSPQPGQQPQQQPQPTHWSQFAAQQTGMDPDFMRLRTVRSQITAANIMGPVSLVIGGMPLSIAGIVCAALAYRGARNVGEGSSPSAPFAKNFMRSARVSIVICCIALVLNAVSFAMMLPVLMEVLNGDMSAIMDMSGLDAGITSDGSSGGSSAWG